MKPAPFEYTRAESLDHACALLAEHGDEAKIIAGGQSLVPMLAMRLLAPAWLVDIQRIGELQETRLHRDQLVLGAGVRQCMIENSASLDEAVPLLRQALRWVGHAPTRNRGTIGGSLAHADPSAELPLVAALLDASLTIKSANGMRQLSAGDFFTGPMMTALEPEECLVDIRIPVWTGDASGCAFDEVSTRHGDFAIVAAAAQLSVNGSGVCTRAAIAIGGAGPTPLAFPDLAENLVGSGLDDGLLREVAQAAAKRVEPTNDLQASAEYRRHLAGVLAERVLRTARQKVKHG